jgi:Fe-Mn family superoxide dismutase
MIMQQYIAPIPCKPWTLNGLSERLIISHYENEYGPTVGSLNMIRQRLAELDLASAPAHEVRSLKREELAALASATLHELYFASIGGDGAALFTGSGNGTGLPKHVAAALDQWFGSAATWQPEFITLAQALRGRPGWVVLSCRRKDGLLHNYVAEEDSQAFIDAVPLLVLDMYEHAYHLEFGANARAYVDAFIRNVDWGAVGNRLVQATGRLTAPMAGADEAVPSISVEELAALRARSERVQVIDARPTFHFSRCSEMMDGAIYRDPDRVVEWAADVDPDTPVVVYCAYGFNVGCAVTAVLRQRGHDARFLRGGLSAWFAAGGARMWRQESRSVAA